MSDRDEALRLHAERVPIREIARRLGRHPSTVQWWCGENGTQSRDDMEARIAERTRRAKALRAQELSYRAIAEELGCSIGTVMADLKR